MEARSWEIPHIALSETKTLVFIDFETTGFVPWKAARIIEYSAIKVTPTGKDLLQQAPNNRLDGRYQALRTPWKKAPRMG